MPGGKAEQNHLHVVVVVECSAEDAALRDINFLDQLGCDEVGRIHNDDLLSWLQLGWAGTSCQRAAYSVKCRYFRNRCATLYPAYYARAAARFQWAGRRPIAITHSIHPDRFNSQ